MKPFLCLTLSATLLAQSPAPLPVDGTTLKSAPGPMVVAENLPDLVTRMGNSRMDLEFRRSARAMGSVPAVDLPPGDVVVTHTVLLPAGWRAYRFVAGPGERVHARLRGDHPAWFAVRCVARQGQLKPGMMQNKIPTGNPEASYLNRDPAPSEAYFVVDTTEVLTGDEPYTLTITRTPAK